MILSLKNFNDVFYGYDIVDCAVRNRNFFHFLVRDRKTGHKADIFSEQSVLKCEVGVYLNSEPDKRVSRKGFDNLDTCYIGATLDKEANEVVLVDCMRTVYARGRAGSNKIENDIPENIFKGVVTRICMIQGRLYVIGTNNQVCYREGINQWQTLSLNLPYPTEDEYATPAANKYDLADIDGFAFDDLYVIGGKGAVWNFNGTQWEAIVFPSNILLESLCCAGDGYVYISGQNGTVFKGRDNEWQLIHRGEFSLPFKDMVWHVGKVWCTSDYGLWVIENNKLIEAEVESYIGVCAGNLSVADGVMLMAGIYGAAYHDNQKWNLIFNASLCNDDGGWLGQGSEEDDEDE